MNKRTILGAMAALLSVGGAATAPPAALPPITITHKAKPRAVLTHLPRASKPTPMFKARARIAGEKRRAKRLRRDWAKHGRVKPITWREARAHVGGGR